MYECLAYVQVCAPDVSGAGRGQKRGLALLKLELEMVLKHNVSPGN